MPLTQTITAYRPCSSACMRCCTGYHTCLQYLQFCIFSACSDAAASGLRRPQARAASIGTQSTPPPCGGVYLAVYLDIYTYDYTLLQCYHYTLMVVLIQRYRARRRADRPARAPARDAAATLIPARERATRSAEARLAAAAGRARGSGCASPTAATAGAATGRSNRRAALPLRRGAHSEAAWSSSYSCQPPSTRLRCAWRWPCSRAGADGRRRGGRACTRTGRA